MSYDLLDLTTSVQDDLKDSSFSSTRIKRYLNHAQKVIFETHEFKFCEKSTDVTLTVGVSSYSQPTDHEATIGGVLIDPDTSRPVFVLDEETYMGHRDFFKMFPAPDAFDNNLPAYWTEFGDHIYFSCPADKLYTLTRRYFRIPTDMSSTTDAPDVPVTFRELLELFADHRAEKYRGNHDVAATYLQEFEDGLEAMALRYSPVTSVGPTIARQTRRRV